MNTLTIWNPVRDLETIQRRLGGFFGGTAMPLNEDVGTAGEWLPPVDVTEDDREYTLKADLPDVKKEDIHVTLHNGSLTFTGERKRVKEEKGKKYHRVERTYGKFERTFAVPENAVAAQAKAQFSEGTLTIHLPKSPEQAEDRKEVEIE